ncbi:F-box protein [Senna tora]|uniref:F-box protein n=1 Tax=Senna tora TaxID=362788 RepID=A0A834XCZ7_9FABA|nr:F-box protein [Senna tora]
MVPRLPNLTDFRCKILSEGKQTEIESDSFKITLFNLRTTNVEHVKALDGNGTKLFEQSDTSRISTWRCLNVAAIHQMRSEGLSEWKMRENFEKQFVGEPTYGGSCVNFLFFRPCCYKRSLGSEGYCPIQRPSSFCHQAAKIGVS